MPMTPVYAAVEPLRDEVDALARQGAVLVEFGAPWCPHCQRVQPLLQDALESRPALTHLKIEDGSGRRLGRSFRVKLWPTLVLLREGQEVARVVRPTTAGDLAPLFEPQEDDGSGGRSPPTAA